MALYFKRPALFDPLALVISATAVDLEVVYAFALGLPTPHLFLHSFPVALSLYPLGISMVAYALERKMGGRLLRIYRAVRWEERVLYSFRTILASSILGSLSHQLIDVWSHPVSPFILWPFTYMPANPLYIGSWSLLVDGAVVVASAYSLWLWWGRWRQSKP